MKYLTLLLLLVLTPALYAQSIQEIEAFSARLEEAVATGDESTLKAIFDSKRFIDLIIDESDDRDMRYFNLGFRKAMEDRGMMTSMLEVYNAESTTYRFVSSYIDNGEAHAVFRLYGDDGINYHNHKLVETTEGLKILDSYVAMTGEFLSETMKRLYLMASSSIQSEKRTGEEEDMMKSMIKATELKEKFQSGNFEAAIDILNGLNSELRKEKTFMLMDLMIKAQLDDGSYMESLSNYQRTFPNDPSSYLISLDYLTLKEEYDACLAAVDKLDGLIKGDDFLNLFRGNLNYLKKDYDAALKYMLQFTQDHADILDGWDVMLSVRVDRKEYTEATSVIEKMMALIALEKEYITAFIEEEPTYADFVKSDEYKAWKEN